MKERSWIIVVLISLISMGIGLSGGLWYAKTTTGTGQRVVYLAKVDFIEGKTLKFTYENGSPRTLSDISKITIWKNKDKRGSITDLKPNADIQVAADQLTEKIYAILILN